MKYYVYALLALIFSITNGEISVWICVYKVVYDLILIRGLFHSL